VRIHSSHVKEHVLLLASATVSAVVNLFGVGRRRPPRRILVVKVDHLGDAILATAALRELRDAYPQAEIDLLTAPAVAPLFVGSSLATRVRTYDAPRYRRRADTKAAPTLDVGPAYDTVVELRGDWSTLAVSFRVGARRRVDRGTVLLQNWWTRRFAAAERPHEVEVNLAVVRWLVGSTPRTPHIEAHIPTEARDVLERRLAEAGIQGREPLVTIHPGAGWRPRAWFPERFAAIADWAREHYDAQIVFVGSAEERDIEAAIRTRMRGPATFWFGTLRIGEMAALLERSRLLIGNDSGVAHLAAAFGTPVIALFGPQDPRRFRPWADSDRAIVLHHRVPCWPCAQARCIRPELPCVNLIEVSEVEAAARAILGPPVDPNLSGTT